jgi:hypothetical protein
MIRRFGVALAQLKDEGMIGPGCREPKAVRVHRAGREYVSGHADDLRAPWEAVAEPHVDLRDVRRELHQLLMTVHQVTVARHADRVAPAGNGPGRRPTFPLPDPRRRRRRGQAPAAPATGRTTEAAHRPSWASQQPEPGVDPA